MKCIRLIVLLIAIFAADAVFSQSDSLPEKSGGDAVIVSLFTPEYPTLARRAGITGDVQLELKIRRDGSVASTAIVKGHTLLKDAALTSAQLSHFECSNCESEVVPYSLTYTFKLVESLPFFLIFPITGIAFKAPIL